MTGNKNQSELVTIVVPVYNVEKYLDRCITSIVSQTYQNLEILLIDDGSPDNCPKMCDDWAKNDARIRVIHKKNQGLGMARNTGIDNAKGDKICFFDSDDYVAPDAIEKSLRMMIDHNADIVVFGINQVKKNGRITQIVPRSERYVFSGREVQEVFLPDLMGYDSKESVVSGIWMSSCVCLYSMELIRRVKWRFVSERDIISEDVYSLLQLYKDVKVVAIIPEAFYYYCENFESLSHTYKTNRFEKIKNFYNACVELCNKYGYGKTVKDRMSLLYYANVLACMKMVVTLDTSFRQKIKFLNCILRDSVTQDALASTALQPESIFQRIMLDSMKSMNAELCYCLIKGKQCISK